MTEQGDPKADEAVAPDEGERLRQLNIRLFKHGLPQVRSLSEFQLRVYRQTNPKPRTPP
jgi:hypothetical protein